ncbi:MAG: Crp/Fnr family transcriptional regulator [Bacteroidales bacterium]
MIYKTQVDGCEDCQECMNKAPYFKILSPAELEILNRDRYSVRYKAGEMILKQGTSATHVLSLIDGIVKIYIEGMGDRNLLLNLQKPWSLLGGPGLHTDRKIHYSVSALTDVSICFIALDNFNKVMGMNCRFGNQLIRHVSNHSVILFDKMISLTQKQMHGRMADGLLYLSKVFFKSDTFKLYLSRQEIADLTAMSKDSAIRILKDFERDRLITLKGNELSILNTDQLLNISLKG